MMMWKRACRSLLSFVPTLVAGLVLCIVLSIASGAGAFGLIATLLEGAWGNGQAIAATFSKLTPLLLTGAAVSLACQVNLLNIGCEGQLTLGALAAASFAVTVGPRLPFPLLAPLTVAAGAAFGAMWAFPAIWLRQRHGVHEVISTLLLNYVAVYAAEYLVLGPLGDGTAMGRTPPVPPGAAWSSVWQMGATGVSAAPLLALFLTFLAQVWLSRTSWGFETRATGSNISAAKTAGIPAEAWQRRLFVLSGALAGLAGALEVVAVHHRFYRAFSPGYGFDGITAAFLANTTPGWLWLSTLLLASLRAADKLLQLALGMSPNAILLIQAVLLLTVACRPGFRSAIFDRGQRL